MKLANVLIQTPALHKFGNSGAIDGLENIQCNIRFVVGGIAGALYQGQDPGKEKALAYLTYQQLHIQKTGLILPPQDFKDLPSNSKLEKYLTGLNAAFPAQNIPQPAQTAPEID